MLGLRAAAKAVLPPAAWQWLGERYRAAKIRSARRAFRRTGAAGQFLPRRELDKLMRSGFREPAAIRYDAEGLELHAGQKIALMRTKLPLDDVRDSLELGCDDGMVAAGLAKLGKNAHALDIHAKGFDCRAQAAGVKFIEADAAAIPLPDESMDLVYSFAAFEHFPEPEAVLREARRVLRKGGYLYLSYGPLYGSPYGRHAYRQVPVPYCHYLFEESDLVAYCNEHGLAAHWPYVNGWTVSRYRELFARHRPAFREIVYKEDFTAGMGAEMITRYPQCFRGRVHDMDDLMVANIELLWKKNTA